MRQPVEKFFADRGPHLAAMIAYFALLSLVPLVFLAVGLLGLAGRPDESSFLVTELERAFPGSSIESIVEALTQVQENAATVGVIGAVTLLWASLSLFSALESAFNIVYERPNRSFLRGKALASLLMIGSLVVLFVALIAGSFGFEIVTNFAPGVFANDYVAYGFSVAVSAAGVFLFLFSVYYSLTNVKHDFRDVLPGSITATIFMVATFQVLPLYLRVATDVIALKAIGGPAILLVWMYLMANVIVFGAEINWWRSHGRRVVVEEAPGLA